MHKFRYVTLLLPVIVLAVSSFLFVGSTPPEEGMYPLSEISKIDLKKAGLKIDVSEIYNPNAPSLVDALVRVGGCTGSFVSNEGLILTNHHCTFDYVRQASTVDQNYLEDGFLAETREQEIPAKGLTCLITVGYEDVSDKVLAAAEGKDVAERIEAIRAKSRQLVEEVKASDPSLTAEVSEMFVGQTYILFKYKTIRDVRLVYAPPRNIGEFGGETDNWVWPRHTGDFTFIRAYVAPDGSPAEFSKDNVPYQPRRFLQVNPEGVDEEDFVFILGYPGRTFRHYPAAFTKMHRDYRLPYIENLFRDLIDLFEAAGKNDPEKALALSSQIKSLANTQKNYLGKMLGMRRLQLVEKQQKEEQELAAFIQSNAELKGKYPNLLSDINKVYGKIERTERPRLFYGFAERVVGLLEGGSTILNISEELQKPDAERRNPFKEENLEKTLDSYKEFFATYYPDVDKAAFIRVFSGAAKLPEFTDYSPLKEFTEADNKEEAVKRFADDLYAKTRVKDFDSFRELVRMSPADLRKLNDPLFVLIDELDDTFDPVLKDFNVLNGQLNLLLAQYLDVKKAWQDKSFIPDANSTLRLTYGYIRGYSPADATFFSPVTTVTGLMEKAMSGNEDFVKNVKIAELVAKKDFGRFVHPRLKDLPVALLYNMDTTGGNSGSPVLDAYGRIIGLNYDRAFEATINDYAWSESYSRSIGVDIRFVLWVTQKVGGADHILKELGV